MQRTSKLEITIFRRFSLSYTLLHMLTAKKGIQKKTRIQCNQLYPDQIPWFKAQQE